MSPCYGLRAEDTAEGAPVPGGKRKAIIVRAGGWPLEQLRREEHLHPTWHTSVRYISTQNQFKPCIMANNCKGFVHAPAATCEACLGLMARRTAFRRTLSRSTHHAYQTRPAQLTRGDLRDALKKVRRKGRDCRDQMAQRVSNAIHDDPLYPQRTTKETMEEFLQRKDVKGVLATLDSFKKKTTLGYTPTTTAISMAQLILANTAKDVVKRKGIAVVPGAKQLLRAVRLVGGEQVYNLLARNLNLPHERNVRKDISKHAIDFGEGMREENFIAIAEMYTEIMTLKGIPFGSVPTMMAEDETAVIAGVYWDAVHDVLVGLCGLLCKKKCTGVTQCRDVRKCNDTHECTADKQVHLLVGCDDLSYENMWQFAELNRVSTYLRLVLINPLRDGVPRLPCLMVGTCLTFTCDGYLLPQWAILEKWYDKHLREILGPLIGHSSDGDSRRRKAMMKESKVPVRRNGRGVWLRFTVHVPSFTFSSRYDLGHPMMCMDQDYIHNIKKLINVLVSQARTVKLGGQILNLGMLEIVKHKFHHSNHGLLQDDLLRKGNKAMDFPSACRLFSPRMLGCIDDLINGQTHDQTYSPFLCGMRRYLGLIRMYASIFMSKRLGFRERIRRAAYVATYLRLWRNYVKLTPGLTHQKNFLTAECFKDVLMSCHFVVLLIKYFAEKHPGVPLPMERTGTDPCEDCFSGLGGWNMNKRTYTVAEAIMTTRQKLQLSLLEATGDIIIPRKGRRHVPPYIESEVDADDDGDDGPPDPPDAPGNGPGLWNNGEVKPWLKGVLDGRRDAQKDGLRPPPNNRRGRDVLRYPREWTDPHAFDPKTAREDSKGEEALIAETTTDAYTDTDLRAEDRARLLEEAGDGLHDAKASDSDSEDDEGDEENETLSSIRRGCAIQAATEAVLLEGQLERATASVLQNVRRYCGRGPDKRFREVHKATVCKWINEGRKGLSADRGKRQAQASAIPMAAGSTLEDFDIAVHEWVVERYNDVAILFDNNVTVGKIVRIRKKMKRGWVEYKRPIVLHRVRKHLGDLYFTCAWYTRLQGRNEIFSFAKAGTSEVHVLSIVCPVSLQFISNNRYLLPPAQATIMKRNLAGDQYWRPVNHTS